MNKKTEGVVIWIVLVGALFFALRLPFLVYGGAPEIHDDVLQPRYTATPLSTERAMTQQAFAMMFFTPTYTVGPTQPFLAFLLPITGATQTFTPTATYTYTATLSATPTRTLLPVYYTQTREQQDGGGGPNPPPPFLTSTPVFSKTPTKIPNLTLTVISSMTPVNSPTPSPIDTDTPAPTETDTPKPANTNKPPTKTPVPTDTPEPPTATSEPPTATSEPPTDIPTNPPVPTETVASGGNSMPGDSSTSSPYFLQFIMMYLLGGTFLGVVFRRR